MAGGRVPCHRTCFAQARSASIRSVVELAFAPAACPLFGAEPGRGRWLLAITCWVNDRLFCRIWTQTSTIPYPQFHALWHLLISIASYTGIIVGGWSPISSKAWMCSQILIAVGSNGPFSAVLEVLPFLLGVLVVCYMVGVVIVVLGRAVHFKNC